MRTKTFSLFFPVFASLLSGVLLVLAFPTYDLGWLAWVGLVPLLVAISGRSAQCGFVLGFVCGAPFFPGVFDWMLEVQGYTFLHHAILFAYLGSYFGFFGLSFSFLCRRFSVTTALLAAPIIWVSLEYIRSNIGFMAHPGALLGHTQYEYPLIIQIASLSGIYGISFLIASINAALASMIFPVVYRLRETKPALHAPISPRGVIATVAAAALLTTITLVYGHITVARPISGKGFKISLVQGNIEQRKKWDRRYAKSIMNTYADLTRRASEDHPVLIIWPEAATPRAINLDTRLYRQVKHIARTAGAYLLLGSSQCQKFKEKPAKELKFTNSAHLIHPEGRAENQIYDKIRLLPFGEYLPMKETIPWSYIQIPDTGSYLPGKDFTIFELPASRFGVTICWESLFPDLVSEFVKREAQFMVNITNEATFGKTAAPYQMLSMNVFRAVENRVYMVRCANTGISCFIDPYGRIVDRVKDATGQDLFVRGVLTETVIPLKYKTIYTRYGNWLAWLCIGCSMGFLLTAFLKKNPGPSFMA